MSMSCASSSGMLRYLLTALCCLAMPLSWAAGEKLPIWTLHSASAEVVLLGSVHMAYPDIYPLREEIEAAFAAADTLVVEVDISGANTLEIQQIMLEKGVFPEGESLQQALSGQTWEDLQSYLRSRGLPVELFARLRPGLVITTLSSMRIAELGMRPELGIDQHFLDLAVGHKPVLELESAAQQIDLLLSFPDQDLLMTQTLVQLGEIDLYLRPVYDAWRAGDAAQLNRLLLTDERQRHPEFELLYEKLFDERNRAMTSKIAGFLGGSGRYFVVVGAGHLVGEEGIISLLEQRGFPARQW
jgi:uncharacterized protein YbaP (TraB family)